MARVGGRISKIQNQLKARKYQSLKDSVMNQHRKNLGEICKQVMNAN